MITTGSLTRQTADVLEALFEGGEDENRPVILQYARIVGVPLVEVGPQGIEP